MTSDLRATLQHALGDAYRVGPELGGGGMSRVFVATDSALGREVVVKVLAPELAAGVDAERFQRETQLAARLQHSYIVPLLSAGVVEGLPFYTMPHVEGESLRQRLERAGEFSLPEAIRILRDVAEALSYAHERGVVHRDIKPGNILLTPYHAHVTDFGIAKAVGAAVTEDVNTTLTAVGHAIGTPAYMAPEQAVGDPSTDHRADIYSFGVVAYEVLTGRPPFSGRTAGAIAAAHALESPPAVERLRPSLPSELGALVAQCLEKRPADRPQTAREIVDRLEQVSVSSGQTVAAAGLARSRLRQRRRMLIAGFAFVAAVLVAAFVAYRAWRAPAVVTLAVLPFENLGPPGDAYLADGIAEEIGNKLAGVPGLTVIGRSSAAHLKRSGAAPHVVGDQLNAAYVLDGSVRWARTPSGESVVRVLPQLIRVSNAAQVWGEPYEGALSQVFALQTEIAEKVTAAVRLRLLPSERTELRRPATTSVAAYEKYLLGRHLWKQRGAALARAAGHFEEAIALDPQFARAYSGLADSYVLMPGFGVTSVSREEAFARAKQAATRAIQLDSSLAESWTSLGLILMTEDTRASYNAYRKAVALDPNYATAQQWYGELLSHAGRYEEAIAAGRRAVELDPVIPVAHTVLANPYVALGRYREAEAAVDRALAIDPQFRPALLLSARTHLEQGRIELARTTLQRLGLSHEDAAVLTQQGRNSQGRDRALAAAAPLNDFYKAYFFAYIREDDLALDHLERSVRNRDPYRNFRSARAFERFRGNPRFEQILDYADLSDRKLRRAGLLE